MTRVLSVTSEYVPLIKTGGLADVAGALPAALAPLGVEMRTLLPGYPAVMAATRNGTEAVALRSLFGGPARIVQSNCDGQIVYVLDAPHLFDRPGAIYSGPDGRDWPDNPKRFAALSLAAARIAADGLLDWQPDVLHAHDWQAGLTPVYLRDLERTPKTGTLLTIHNIAFQGIAAPAMLSDLRLPKQGFTMDGFEFFGWISALKAGIVYSDKISTVSPTYAGQLLTPEFGMGLDGLLRHRRDDLVGILNGIDLDAWKPPYARPVSKKKHKAALRAKLGLPESDGPLCVVVSRLTQQKGLDLLLEALPALLAEGGQLAVLGSGDSTLEAAFRAAAARHDGVAVQIGYDEALSRQLIAGGDAILVPSRFEPCGLTQLYGLRFGTVPLVALTGGLADTVIPANSAALAVGAATGFQFFPVDTEALIGALRSLVHAYRTPEIWTRMQRNAMAQPVGWETSAAEYAALYQTLKK